jgi:putative PIN family toxin of toxin-antitoxin system
MTPNNRVVLDTNTIVSALLISTSLPRQAFDRAIEHHIICVSDSTIAELTDVLQRPRFDRYITLERRLQFLAEFVQTAIVITITETITDCRDPKDNKFLEVAVCGQADVIISGDRDLLVLHPYRGITIIPRTIFSLAHSTATSQAASPSAIASA